MNRTKNELADYAWNPVTGCLKDCRYCYAKKSALRFASDWRRNLAERPKVQQVGANLFALDAPWADRHPASSSRVQSAVEELRQLWEKRTPMTFTAGGDSYENVCIESVTFPKEESNSERIELKLKQVSINSTETANISIKYARGGTSKKNTGASQKSTSTAKSSSSGKSSSRSSILCSGAKAIGLFK